MEDEQRFALPVAFYQHEVLRTLDDTLTAYDRLILAALGLAGETGEVVDIIKKQRFTPARLSATAATDLLDELGDVLWYLTVLADCYGWTLQQVMAANIVKVRERYPNGFVKEGPGK